MSRKFGAGKIFLTNGTRKAEYKQENEVELFSPGIKPRSPTLQVDSLPVEPQRKSNKRVAHTRKNIMNTKLLFNFAFTFCNIAT